LFFISWASISIIQNKLAPRVWPDDMPLTMAVSTRGGSPSISGLVRSLRMAKLQAASVPIAYGSCTMGQTGGWIAVSCGLMLPYGGGHDNR